MRSIAFLFVTLIVIFAAAMPARADHFVWRDVNTGLSLAFPDNWKVINNASNDDIITIAAPSGNAHAQCRARALDDRRYLIYPPRFSADIQKTEFSGNFWKYYLSEYNDGRVLSLRDGAGLGRGFASYAVATYQNPYMGDGLGINRKALMFVSLYNDKAYVLECSCRRDAFEEWKPLFLSVAKSVDFMKTHNELMTGNYRNFLREPRIVFPSLNDDSSIIY